MTPRLILASASRIRAQLLEQAGIAFEVDPARIDEDEVKRAMRAEGASAREIADTLAELKALSRARDTDDFILGADQTLSLGDHLFDKARTVDEVAEKLKQLRGKTHSLHCAACIARNGAVIWRHVNTINLHMRAFSDRFLERYIATNPATILRSVGAYELEGHGSQLFSAIDGDYFSVLGLPLLELQAVLREHGILET